MKASPYHLLKVARNLSLAAMGVPLNKDASYEERLYRFCEPLMQEHPRIAEIMDGISDEEIVFQKGEGPEVVLSKDPLVARKGFARISKYFIAKRVQLILEQAPNIAGCDILDVGATSDLLFRYLGLKGTGLNISERAVCYMRNQGIEAVHGNAEHLPYPDRRFDFTFSFETIEHLENPMKGLKELCRITREQAFVTIPNVARTAVCTFEPEDRGQHRWHFIEFSVADFTRVAERAGFEIVKQVLIRPVSRPRTLQDLLFLMRWFDDAWLEGWQFFALRPAARV